MNLRLSPLLCDRMRVTSLSVHFLFCKRIITATVTTETSSEKANCSPQISQLYSDKGQAQSPSFTCCLGLCWALVAELSTYNADRTASRAP